MFDKYIDIHSHVLWDIDDGSKDIDETIARIGITISEALNILFGHSIES